MITIRNAGIGDVELLLKWDQNQHVIDADPAGDWQWDQELKRDPEWREQLIAEKDGQPIAFVQIIDPANEESHYWGQIGVGKRAIDIWIGEKENLGKGFGTQIMELVLRRCFEIGAVTEVLIDPFATNHRAINFYKRLGFKFVEDRIFDGDECEIFSLKKGDWLTNGR